MPSQIENYINLAVQLKKQYPIAWGDPRYQLIGLRKLHFPEGQLVPTSEDIILDPACKVVPVPSRMVGSPLRNNNIMISQDDLMIDGIPRTYSEEYLTQHVQYVVIDPVKAGSVFTSGKPYELIFLDGSKMLSYSMVVRDFSDSTTL